jgi:hypothetical protein
MPRTKKPVLLTTEDRVKLETLRERLSARVTSLEAERKKVNNTLRGNREAIQVLDKMLED